VIAGCGKKEEAKLEEAKFEVDAETPSWKVDEDSADLTWYINFDWFAQVWGEDKSSVFISEDTKVNITYQGGADDKLNTMLASGDLPDIITIDGSSPIVSEAAKFALPLDELAEKYDPYFLKHAAKEETVKFFTKEDGHIYGYPNFSTTTEDYEGGGVYGNQVFLVREDIYETLGKPDMTTPEGLKKALEEAKALGVKDGLGKDIIPFGMTDFSEGSEPNAIFTKTLADFIGVPVLTEDNEFYDRYTDEDLVKWTKAISDIRRDGLTDKDMITMTKDDKDARLSNGSYFAFFAPDVLAETDPLALWDSEHADQSYIAVNGPSSTIGRDSTMTSTTIEGWTQTFISKTCKNPQKAMELITYLVSEEGDTVMNYGREGETYELVDGIPVLNQDLLEFKQKDPGAFEKEVGLTTHLWLQDSARLSRYMGLDQFPTALQQPKEWTLDKVQPQFELAGVEACLSKESNRNMEKIKQKWAQTVAEMLDATSDEEVDKAMEEFVKYRDENGYDKIVEEKNAQIQINVDKLK
jgi:putative aldouronate transport system substrate-binding protein